MYKPKVAQLLIIYFYSTWIIGPPHHWKKYLFRLVILMCIGMLVVSHYITNYLHSAIWTIHSHSSWVTCFPDVLCQDEVCQDIIALWVQKAHKNKRVKHNEWFSVVYCVYPFSCRLLISSAQVGGMKILRKMLEFCLNILHLKMRINHLMQYALKYDQLYIITAETKLINNVYTTCCFQTDRWSFTNTWSEHCI